LLTIDRQSRVPIYRQIENYFVRRIRSRELAPGAVIPRAVDLAENLGISHLTVRQCYKRLAEQRLVNPIRGKGTFVARDESSQQQTLGVAVPGEFFRSQGGSGVYTAIAERLHNLAREDGRMVKLLVCTTPYLQQVGGHLNEHDLRQLRDEAMAGLFVCGTHLPPTLRAEYKQRGVRAVGVPGVSEGVDAYVTADQDSAISTPIRYAQAQGRRRPGILYLDLEADHRSRQQRLIEALGRQGFDPDPAQVVGVSHASMASGQFATEHLLRTRPQVDAIICYDDLLTHGVCAACIRAQLRVPEQVLLVSHVNRNITPPYLLPVARVSLDVDRMTEMAYEKMRCLLDGRPADSIADTVRPTLIPEHVPDTGGVEMALTLT
jgi:DNA-binding LacI/PurR family transcriptional regulator